MNRIFMEPMNEYANACDETVDIIGFCVSKKYWRMSKKLCFELVSYLVKIVMLYKKVECSKVEKYFQSFLNLGGPDFDEIDSELFSKVRSMRLYYYDSYLTITPGHFLDEVEECFGIVEEMLQVVIKLNISGRFDVLHREFVRLRDEVNSTEA